MKLFRLMFRRETAVPMLALSFASAVSVALVIGRIAWMRDSHYAFLIWNLFLAWLPMIFALLAREHQKEDANPGWRFLAFGGAWLLFFPNAPYIFTDIVHLKLFYSHFWVDLMLILINALTGLIVGFLSLYLMQSAVRRMAGNLASWIFIAAVALLSGFGMFLGRFLRLNSWDVVAPGKMFHLIGDSGRLLSAFPGSIAFSIMFAAFVFIAYLMLYALTHLSPPQMNSVQAGK
ncbi:MAG TPA: DUF1361 domain-containing protein [Verrucomicrobiae bacterium]|jgi:uncharacterized membrane protein|nr:DUF1361 domain-containing protein [Verrucomicrobiae bacterium]